jgi:hypothetical protein
MSRRASRSGVAALIVVSLSPTATLALQSPATPLDTKAIVLQSVRASLTQANTGNFKQARTNLETILSGCPTGTTGRDCRVLAASGLGAVLQRQGSSERANRDSLYTASAGYYDRVLREVPNDPDAMYGKALAYRALGPRDSMESFFAQAPSLDTARAALYLTFQGDYFAAKRRWPQAIAAYREAVRQDGENDGARSGLVDALTAQASRTDLLQFASGWEARYPASASNAYRAVLILSFAPGAQRDAIADSAMVGLVRVQTRNRLAVGDVPRAVSQQWTPVHEIHAFLDKAAADSARWWRLGPTRETVLAQAALAGGKAAASRAQYDAAERLFVEGERIARRSSAVSLDLQRELALLYFQHATLDPDHRKFDALEQDIFEGKMGALANGDLEAAQRYHTTLGLIYAARGVWTSANLARNAEQQFEWALGKADERQQRQRFYQALPEMRQLLARHLDSTGHRGQAAQRYAEAARAYLDIDDLTSADAAAKNAARLGDPTSVAGVQRVLALRSDLTQGGDVARRDCTPARIATLARSGDAAFIARQLFKVLADCAASEMDTMARRHATGAFRLVDSAGITLVGGNDVARFERVMRTMLQPFGVTPESSHLDPAPAPDGPAIQVSIAGETVPYWYTASMDDVIAARVAAALGVTARPVSISVVAGVLTIPKDAAITADQLARLKAVAGVRGVRLVAQ